MAQGIVVNITDDKEKGLLPVKGMLALYVGGMGAKDRNFHKELISRFGFEAEAQKIQDLYLAGKKDEAMMAVPDQLADEISLVGTKEEIRDRLQAWKENPRDLSARECPLPGGADHPRRTRAGRLTRGRAGRPRLQPSVPAQGP